MTGQLPSPVILHLEWWMTAARLLQASSFMSESLKPYEAGPHSSLLSLLAVFPWGLRQRRGCLKTCCHFAACAVDCMEKECALSGAKQCLSSLPPLLLLVCSLEWQLLGQSSSCFSSLARREEALNSMTCLDSGVFKVWSPKRVAWLACHLHPFNLIVHMVEEIAQMLPKNRRTWSPLGNSWEWDWLIAGLHLVFNPISTIWHVLFLSSLHFLMWQCWLYLMFFLLWQDPFFFAFMFKRISRSVQEQT